MRRFVFWGLLPFVIPQALRLRRTAPRFKGAQGEPKGVVGTGPRRHLIAIGDSIIAGVGASQFSHAMVGRTAEFLATGIDSQIAWQALGKIGIRTQGVVERLLPQLPPEPVDFFLVSAGVNDVTSLTKSAQWLKHLTRLLQGLSAHSPHAVIAVAGMPPMQTFPLLPQPLRTLLGTRSKIFDDALVQCLVSHPQAVHVPIEFEPHPAKFSADGFHPSEASYVDFGKAMARGIIQLLATNNGGGRG